jgi:predicted SnoaL-like aldol condensation-catalyzing enzyme
MEDEAKHPGKQLDVRLALQDGDHVAVHSRLKHPAFEPEVAVVHIFRFENGRIVEAWDIVQMAPEQIVNTNGMF